MLTLLLFFTTFCNAQYISFPDSTAIWRENRVYSPQPPNWENWDYQNYLGDVIFDDGITTIIEVFQSGYDYGSYNGNTFNIYYNNLVGWLQKDTSKQVYLADQGVLLYDFDLQVGDTLPESYVNSNSSAYDTEVITSIDSVFDGIIYRKRYNFKTIGSSQLLGSLIEGIGSTFGLLNQIQEPTLNESSVLNCVKINNRTVYPDTTNNCNILLNNNYHATDDNSIKVFPNPATDVIHLRGFGFSNKTVEIYNLLGNLVLEMNSLNSDVNIGSLEDGLYFIRSGKLNGKFIKVSE